MSTEWEYKGIDCVVYEVPVPDNPRYLGYLVFGDEWVEVVDKQGIDESTVFDIVEDEVDSMIDDLQSDDDQMNDWGRFPDHDDPFPDIDPNPNPDPFPFDPPDTDPRPQWDSPIWMSYSDVIAGVPVVTDGTTITSDTTGGTTIASLSSLNAGNIDSDGLYTVDEDNRKS